MVAFQFPPAAVGSGYQRPLGFARYLPEFGWEPVILTAGVSAYPRVSAASGRLVPAGCEVHRAFALDAGRHFAIHGKYPGFLAKPDRWISWWLPAVLRGLGLIRKRRIDAIWSTYPIMTAHAIARTLSRRSRLPWVADFRDPVANSVSTNNSFALHSQRRGERRVMDSAARVVVTTSGALHHYAKHWPTAAREGRLCVIANGYDDEAFANLAPRANHLPSAPLRLVHSGVLYPDGRDPVPFLTALSRLRNKHMLADDAIQVVLRASGSEDAYREQLRRLDLEGMVELAPPVSNREALEEQAAADGLLLFQGDKFDRQIPAKVYGYLRIGRPIFALIGKRGDTAALLRETGGATSVPLDDADAIEAGLLSFLAALRTGSALPADAAAVTRYSRRSGAAQLAGLLTQVST